MSSKILILTILSESESKAVKNVFELEKYGIECSDVNCEYPTYYSNDKSIVFSFLIDKGNEAAGIATITLVDTFKPQKVILVGTCAGRPEKTKVGDVIISSLGVFDYSQTSFVEKDEKRFYGFNPSSKLSREFAFLQGDKDLNRKWWPLILSHAIDLDVADFEKIDAKLFAKAIASGARIIDELSMEVLTDANEIIYGADQESSGFARACAAKRIEWIVVRGVSDCGERIERKANAILATISAASIVKLYMDNNDKSSLKTGKPDPKPSKSDLKPAKSDLKPAKSDLKPAKSDLKPSKVRKVSPTDITEKVVNLLGCSHIWVPNDKQKSKENKSRNEKKITAINESNGTFIYLLAQTGYSYLHNRAVFFDAISNHLDIGGTFSILLSDISTDNIVLSKDDIETRILKYNQVIAGYHKLKKKYKNRVHLRTINLNLPATLLITKDVCFYEPYIHIPAEREELLFTSFEMLFDQRVSEHGHKFILDYFNYIFDKAVDLP